MKKQSFLGILITILYCLFFSQVSLAAEKIPIEYQTNSNDEFPNANDFYKTLNSKVYQEPKSTTYKVRKKTTFKNVINEEYNFYKNIGREKEDIFLYSPAIHPDRQVYFLGYAHTKGKKHYTKFVVLDAQTKDTLYGGETMEVPKFETFPF